MSLNPVARSPRHLMSFFIATILLPAAALVFMAWRTLEQDRELERQHIRDRLESVATAITAGLESRLRETTRLLSSSGQTGDLLYPPGTILLSIDEAGITASPPGRLLYYPTVPSAKLPPTALAAAEELEFRRHDDAGAAAAYRGLTRAPDASVQAHAWLGLARCLLRGGRHQEALAAYDRLARLDVVIQGDIPAGLVARIKTCEVLSERKAQDARPCAMALQRDLHSGRWRIDRSSYQLYSGQVKAWLPPADVAPPDADALSLADAADTAVEIRQRLKQQPGRGWATAWSYQRPVLIAWENTPARLSALEMGPRHMNSWPDLWQNQNVAVMLTDAEGHRILGQPLPPERLAVLRSAMETGLPWTLHVASADPGKEYRLAAGRRRVVLGGLAVIGILIVAGGFLVARARAGEQALARMQKDFVAAVSHEFRSPLTTMRHLLEMLDQGAVGNEERRRQYYRVLVREATRLHRLVENLLNFGRLEEGRAEYQFETVRAADLVAGVTADFANEPAARDRLKVMIGAPEATIIADREALGRALWNLLDNAAKYSEESAPIFLDLTVNEEQVRIQVRDQGPGIPPEEQKAVFQKFYRGAATRDSGVKGTGIGLATVEHIVRAHKGKIELDSKPGNGSSFTVVLPIGY